MKEFDKKKIIISGGALLVVLLAMFALNNFKTYTVIFDSKMGTSIKAQEVRKNELCKKPNDPVMTGYVFLGWFVDDKEFDFNTKITENITLVGKWQEISE